MACNKSFASSYMLLKPEEAGFFDLLSLLFSSDLKKRKFVDCSEGREESFWRRWLIFISVVVQKLLQLVAKPLAFVGSLIEFWLNLLSLNGNLLKLLLNFIRGKVVMPYKSSATFISFIGNWDKRVELDSSIKRGDANYNAALAMMASKISYENYAYIETTVEDHWQMDFLGSYDYWNDYQEKATTQAFVLSDYNEDEETIVVAFRGTEPFDSDAWSTDFDISWYEIQGMGKIHSGFMKALGLQKNDGWPKDFEQDDSRPYPLAYYALRDVLKNLLSRNDKAKFIVTGHSLGGALAILFPAILMFHEETWLLSKLEGIYTFGQPRVGDKEFRKFMEYKLRMNGVKYFRSVYCNDMVPRLPFDDKALMFKHFGTCLNYDRHYEGKVVAEQPNKNYFSLLAVIPMMVNAFFELIRSFTIVSKRGEDYREGWLLRVIRVIGLVIPGIPAHGPQDYVNSTRLGPSDVFLQPLNINQ